MPSVLPEPVGFRQFDSVSRFIYPEMGMQAMQNLCD